MEEVGNLGYTPGPRGYFMSEEEKDALVGRLMREHRESGEHLASLRASADRLGQRLLAVAQGCVRILKAYT
jgi:hypothetical protein